MKAIFEAASQAYTDTTDPVSTPVDVRQSEAEDVVTLAIANAADAVEQHVPEGPFKPLAHALLQSAVMFAVKGIFRRR